MNNNRVGVSLNDNLQWIEENNFSIVDDDTDIWTGELPYKTGTKFPTSDIRERAMISKTNKLIYNNRVDDIYYNIISIFPEIDPMYGWQIREIITSLPYFKNATNAWVGLVAGDTPLVDINEEYDVELSELLESSNFAETIQNEVRSRFLDIISAYRVDIGTDGKPIIVAIESKNLICFVNKDIPNCIEVNVVFSIYKDKFGEEYIDFVEYHNNGLIRKHKFNYSNGTIGTYADEVKEELAFGGKFKSSPIVVFKHNVVNNEIYGTDQYRYWSPGMLAGMRELQNVLRLGERTREMIRKVPDSAIKKNSLDGSSVFYNKGTIGYKEGTDKSPDIEYIVPEIRMEEAMKALDSAIRQISMDTQLGISFFNPEALGSNLSAESIRATMYPARLEAQRIVTEMKPSVKELVIKLGYIADLDISSAKLSVEFYDGFPKDELDDIKAVQMRLESSSPSITLEDAIMKLDRVPLRVAKQKALEILRGEKELTEEEVEINKEIVEGDNESKQELNKNNIRPTAMNGNKDNNLGEYIDDTVWDNQMAIKPRDIPQGIEKSLRDKEEVKKLWAYRKLRERV